MCKHCGHRSLCLMSRIHIIIEITFLYEPLKWQIFVDRHIFSILLTFFCKYYFDLSYDVAVIQ